MNNIKWKPLLLSLAVSLGTGLLSAMFSSPGMGQYENMYQPPLAPPGWLFPVVWTILYTLMGVASYIVYTSDASEKEKRESFLYYGAQLAVNFFWSIIFFNWNAYLLAFAWLLLLWYLIFETLRRFYQIKPIAGYLLIPYLVWVTFAGYLNLAIAIYYF